MESDLTAVSGMLNGACDTADTGPPVFYDDNRQGENGTEQIPCNRYRRIQRQAHYRLAGERANPDGVNVLPWMLCGTTEIGEARLKRYGDLHEDHAPSPGQHDHGRADASAGKKIRRESTGRLSGLNRRMHYSIINISRSFGCAPVSGSISRSSTSFM